MATIHFLILTLLLLASNLTFSLPLQDSPNFDSEIALFGDAAIVNGGSAVQLTRPTGSSSGLLVYNKPFKFIHSSSPLNPTSFSTDFSFSISPDPGDGLVLLFVPAGFPDKYSGKTSFGLSQEVDKFLGIEFDTSMDLAVGDENANHVGIDVCSLVSSRVGNVSSLNLVLNSGQNLRSWVDYDASSKRLEVRLSEMRKPRPYNPFLAFQIDLLEMWKGEEVFVGISSSSGNSAQTISVYSWKFRVRNVPNSMHSQPVDPLSYHGKGGEQRPEHKKVPCPLNMLSGLVLLIGCGALVALIVQSLWAIFAKRHSEEYSFRPADFGYKKLQTCDLFVFPV
ncbi:L-type lectin-domain containing receptor kinase VIII.2-like isoform X2 [Diospyros lotus]|uniref:L-type lectin-domain containing receptor kinase VIII.2-like isoform X2 n=1 Tax=Diospyros lotus TaxID=55363 RepID=UPI0022569B4E|nr:L-type lectin-domain containing receptor kinase VIII.2-like isoform X2 [Diospyros lotus]